MIKINLLGVAPPPGPAVGPPATRAFQVSLLLGSLVVSFLIVGFFYWTWNADVKAMDAKVKQEQARERDLAVIKQQNDQYQARLRDLEQRINTIQTLQVGRVGPVEQMTALGDAVNKVNDVFLFNMVPTGDRLTIHGQSGSVNSMATFLSALEKTPSFQDVQLRQFFQDNQRDQLSFKFTVDFLYKPPTATPVSGQAGAPAAPAAPAAGARRTGR